MEGHHYTVLFADFSWDYIFAVSVEEAIELIKHKHPNKIIVIIFKEGVAMKRKEKIEVYWED